MLPSQKKAETKLHQETPLLLLAFWNLLLALWNLLLNCDPNSKTCVPDVWPLIFLLFCDHIL
uniref:Uncharacterized protein n=1 Tax=Populus trichocarpa TaxID=3694 RepID=A0A2K1XAE8_POPTR